MKTDIYKWNIMEEFRTFMRVECTGDCDNGVTTGIIIQSPLNDKYGCVVRFDNGEEEWIDYDQLCEEIK